MLVVDNLHMVFESIQMGFGARVDGVRLCSLKVCIEMQQWRKVDAAGPLQWLANSKYQPWDRKALLVGRRSELGLFLNSAHTPALTMSFCSSQ